MLLLSCRRGLSLIALTTALIGLLVLVGPAGSALAQCGPDPAFDRDGVLVTDLGTSDELARGVTALPDGAAIVAGEARHMTAARYLPDGTLDPAFGGGDGIAQVSHDPIFSSAAYDVAVQPDGKVVLAGNAAFAVSGSSGFDIAVARLNPDGTRDASFGGGDGAVYLDLQGRHDWAAAVAVDSAGRIVVAGHSEPFEGNASDAVVVRLLPDGSLDPSFGNQGIVVLDLGAKNQGVAHGLALQADGAIVVAGSYGRVGSGVNPWLGRLLGDGSRDRRFGRKGLVLSSVGGTWYDVTVQPDGRIVTAGEVLAELTVARYLPNGKTDDSFGAGGMTRVQVDPSGFLSSRASAVAIHADGTILAVGAAWATNLSDMAAVALLADGTPDARFGTGGVVHQHDPAGFNSALQDVALLPNGSALAAGYLGFDWALARYTPCV
jgi:uncharacterized delta-60 repeat protein